MVETNSPYRKRVNPWINLFLRDDVKRKSRVMSITWIRNQSSYVLFGKKLSSREISNNLEVTLGREAVSYQFVTCYLREAKCASGNCLPLVFL